MMTIMINCNCNSLIAGEGFAEAVPTIGATQIQFQSPWYKMSVIYGEKDEDRNDDENDGANKIMRGLILN